jgi:hypothetical protein
MPANAAKTAMSMADGVRVFMRYFIISAPS